MLHEFLQHFCKKSIWGAVSGGALWRPLFFWCFEICVPGLHCHGVPDGTVLERSSLRSSLLTSGTSAHSIDSHCPDLRPAGCGTCQAPLPCCEWTFHSLRDWAHVGAVLCEPPTASSHFGSTGVLWVLTRTHPCGPPPRMMEVTRAPALVERGAWSWCCCQVVLWSHREVWEYECISTDSASLKYLESFMQSISFCSS